MTVTKIYEMKEEKEILELKENFMSVQMTNRIEKEEMFPLLLCLKRMKINLPKPLRIKIFHQSESVLILSNQNFLFIKNGNIFKKVEHNVKDTKKATFLDPIKKEFAFLHEVYENKEDEESDYFFVILFYFILYLFYSILFYFLFIIFLFYFFYFDKAKHSRFKRKTKKFAFHL